jgi:TMEM175 potassium channel family protein
MPTSYNQITGQSLERLAALSDGIFAVAMTLLVLDLHLPAKEVIHSQGELWHTLAGAAPQLISYLMSFMTLGIFWNGQQAQLNSFSRSDRHLSWIHIAFLFLVSIMPFSTRLLAEFISYRSALIAYWGNILLLGVVLFASWRYATRAGLLREEISRERQCAVERRIVVAQGLYAVGACLCLFNTYASIVFIILVQLNFALGLRLPYLSEV